MMCDLQKRKPLDFHFDSKKMRFIKKSRWELPRRKSSSYWNEICNNLEKEIHRVRDPFSYFPFIPHSDNKLDFDPHDSAEFNNLSKVQSYDEPIVKVSPPTPSRKSSFIFTTDASQDQNAEDKKYPDSDSNLIRKLRSLKENRNNITLTESYIHNNAQISLKRNCTHHKNEQAPQFFDDDLKKCLPKRKSSNRQSYNKTSNNSHVHLNKSSSKSSSGLCSSDSRKVDEKDHEILQGFVKVDSLAAGIESQPFQNSMNPSIKNDPEMEYGIGKRIISDTKKATRTPKLGKASLLASFAKTISIQSSVETHESSEEDPSKPEINLEPQSPNKYGPEFDSGRRIRSADSVPKDYLRVPKLGYASLHPSFRKLSPIDSFPNEEESFPSNLIPRIVSEYSSDSEKSDEKLIDQEILNVEDSLRVPSVSSSNIEDTIADDPSKTENFEKSRKSDKIKKRQDYSTRYAYRALNLLTKKKHLTLFPKETKSSSEESSGSSSTSGSSKSGYRIRRNEESDLDPTVFKDIREKLRTVAPKYLGQYYSSPSKKSVGIKTIASTTRSASGSSSKFQNFQLQSKTLATIPTMKMFPRRIPDRCLPCLFKTFEKPSEVKRELPITLLSSIIKEPFSAVSESETSSVSLPSLKTPDFESLISDRGFDNKRSGTLTEEMLGKEVADGESKMPGDDESVVSKDQSLSIKSFNSRKVSIQSGSVLSTDISKPSTPSGQSSESEDARQEVTNETLDTSKYLAPCHAPLVWKPSLESLKALRLRKATSMQSRTPVIISKSDDDSDLEDSLTGIPISQGTRKRDRKASSKTVTIQSPDLKEKSDRETDSESKAQIDESCLREKRKKLVRTRTVAGQMTVPKTDEEKKDRFVRAKTSMDLISKISDSDNTCNLDESVEDSIISREDLIRLKEESREGKKSMKLSKEDQEVLEILEKSMKENESPGVIFKRLCDWFSSKVVALRKDDIDLDSKRTYKIMLNLLRLLAESKRYLNSEKLSPDLEFSSTQPPLCNSRLLRRILPLESYNMVAPILNMPMWYPKKVPKNKGVSYKDKNSQKERKRSSSSLTSDLFVHPPSLEESFLDDHDRGPKRLNPYARFLVKPRRKVIRWRPLREEDLKGFDPDSTLHNRATQMTHKICYDFCEWLRGMSGTLERINEEVLKDMFQIVFTADACKSMQVVWKELPTVPKPIASARNLVNATELGMTRKELTLDCKIEKKPQKTFAFGTALPKKLRFIPPKNEVETKWLSCENVPQEVETMDAVWRGIKNLESVRRYFEWLENNTNVSLPEIPEDDIKDLSSLSRFSQEDIITQVDFDKR